MKTLNIIVHTLSFVLALISLNFLAAVWIFISFTWMLGWYNK